MTDANALLTSIQDMDAEIQSYIAETTEGRVIDISGLPNRLAHLHEQVEQGQFDNKDDLVTALQAVLASLDGLSHEIQHHFQKINVQLQVLEPDKE
ncbi:hypothetical protein [Sneathiella chinensis]|uniref:Transcriptional regulator n=1 Tax=Sneathiella chinensis TaxID=349750 RepID=A0ABQ5U597_9PROT|nr:hypothetical protein [Sneathiella chinensis]GLQ07337.1 hypothetical protein GCM10007924_25580 [Sneathiella chinensis]